MKEVHEIQELIDSLQTQTSDLEADVSKATLEAQDATDKADGLAVMVEMGEANQADVDKATKAADQAVLEARQLGGLLAAKQKAREILRNRLREAQAAEIERRQAEGKAEREQAVRELLAAWKNLIAADVALIRTEHRLASKGALPLQRGGLKGTTLSTGLGRWTGDFVTYEDTARQWRRRIREAGVEADEGEHVFSINGAEDK